MPDSGLAKVTSGVRLVLALTIAVVVVIVATVVVPERGSQRSTMERGPHDTAQPGSSGAQDHAVAANETEAPLGILVTAPPGREYPAVRVWVADAHRRVASLDVVPNGAAAILATPPRKGMVIGPVLDESAPAPAAMAGLRWPRPVSLHWSEGVPEKAVVLRFESIARADGSVRIEATLNDRSPDFDLSCRLDQLCSGTKVPFPMALVNVERGSGVRGGLQDGYYSVSLTQLPDDCTLTSRREEYRFAARPGSETKIRFEFESAGSLSGRVVTTDALRRSPVSVFQDLGNGRFRARAGLDTDEEGKFQVDQLPGGRYYVTSWPEGHMSTRVVVDVLPGRPVEVELHPTKGGRCLSGVLANERDLPMPRIRLNLNRVTGPFDPPAGKAIRTDQSGRFTWDGLEPGPYHVIAWDLGLMRRFLVDAHSPMNEELKWTIPDLAAENSYEVSGTVRLADGSTVRPGARVCLEQHVTPHVEGWFRFSETRHDSCYTISGVAPGVYRVWIEPGAVVGGFEPGQGVLLHVTDRNVDLDLEVPQR